MKTQADAFAESLSHVILLQGLETPANGRISETEPLGQDKWQPCPACGTLPAKGRQSHGCADLGEP